MNHHMLQLKVHESILEPWAVGWGGTQKMLGATVILYTEHRHEQQQQQPADRQENELSNVIIKTTVKEAIAFLQTVQTTKHPLDVLHTSVLVCYQICVCGVCVYLCVHTYQQLQDTLKSNDLSFPPGLVFPSHHLF